MENKQLLWGGLGVLAVLLVAGVAYWASLGVTPSNNPTGQLTIPVSADDWSRGAGNPKVTIVEYSDLECPACAAYEPVVEKVLADNQDTVQLVYRHFPLSQHRSSQLAALYAEAAGKQGKFWEMHDKLFATQDSWTINPAAKNEPIFQTYAQELGLDMVKLATDLKDPSLQAKIKASYDGGVAAGVDSTPSFFINGERVKNPRTLDEFEALITSYTSATSTNPTN